VRELTTRANTTKGVSMHQQEKAERVAKTAAERMELKSAGGDDENEVVRETAEVEREDAEGNTETTRIERARSTDGDPED
jgi:hypothetical protein